MATVPDSLAGEPGGLSERLAYHRRRHSTYNSPYRSLSHRKDGVSIARTLCFADIFVLFLNSHALIASYSS